MLGQSLEELVEWEKDSTGSVQVLRLFSAIVDASWDSRVGMRGSEGFREPSRSRSRMRAIAVEEMPG